MKKKILSIVFALLLIPAVALAQANYFRDIIVTSPDGLWTDARAYATLNDAVTAVGADERVILIADEQVITALTVPVGVTLVFTRDGSITNSGQLTIEGNIVADKWQIFTGAGDIDFISGSVVKSSWFTDIARAVIITNDDSVTIVVTEPSTVDENCVVGANVTLRWEAPNLLTSGFAPVLSGIKNIEAGQFQLFTGTGDFDFLAGAVLRSSWFSSLATLDTYTNDDNVALTIHVDQPETVAASMEFDAFQHLAVDPGCLITLDAAQTLTVNSSISAGLYQIFTSTGTIAGAIKQLVIPDDWFAGTETVTLSTSLDALDQTEAIATLGLPADLVDLTATAVEINTTSDGAAAKNAHIHDIIRDPDGNTNVEIPAAGSNVIFMDVDGTQVFEEGPSAKDTWIKINSHEDKDGDTKIQVEEGADDDTFRVDIGGAEVLVLDTEGLRVSNQPSFSAAKGASQDNIAAGSEITVVWNTETFDTGADFAANGFTIPVDGKYHFSASVTIEDLDTAADYYSISISIGATPYFTNKIDPEYFSGDVAIWSLVISGTINADIAMNPAYVTVRQQGGAAQADITAGNFSGFLVH